MLRKKVNEKNFDLTNLAHRESLHIFDIGQIR